MKYSMYCPANFMLDLHEMLSSPLLDGDSVDYARFTGTCHFCGASVETFDPYGQWRSFIIIQETP